MNRTELARWLWAEHQANNQFVPFAPANGIATLQEAYDAQEAYVDVMQSAGLGAVSGWKIGLTSARMQEMCGIDQPAAGAVLAARMLPSGANLSLATYGRLGLEFEIAVRLGRDLPPGDTPPTLADVVAAVDGVAAGVELVDDRRADYAQLDVLSLIADNSWNAGVLLGDFVPPSADLEDCKGVISLNGAEIDRGSGRDVLGGPMQVLHWLASHLSRRGRGLRAGDVVMTGSIIATQFPEPGARYLYALEGVGSLSLSITQ
ncbi:MAG TPA: hypothetical protein GX700_01500 [Paracoccus sp.]|nr:hypothetical protein [Paracoccus sp. (in: a-proteobacteria)]